jgi:UDP-2-acetamido-2-deoxy-ribo-hexuluronate aminotransferase
MEISLPIQMYDPTRDYIEHKEQFDNQLKSIINSGLFIGGPEVKKLEEELSKYTKCSNVITCGNGTDAIFIVLKSLDIKEGDEIITVAHTWISTSETIAMIGATPVFIDICSDNFNIDYSQIEVHINNKTKAILFVSLYGLMPNLEILSQIAKKHNLYLIEDGAQSFGAEFKKSKSCSCVYTDVATTSFFPSKPLGCWGDGGAIFTNNNELAKKIRAIKSHGGLERFKHKYIGLNSRLDTIQAGILLTKLKYFEETVNKRIECADFYSEQLNYIQSISIPKYDKANFRHVWAQYSILCKNKVMRDEIVDFLKQNKVNVSIFYPIGLHKQECFKNFNYKELETTDYICDRIFNLPCYAELKRDEQVYIINLLTKFFQ